MDKVESTKNIPTSYTHKERLSENYTEYVSTDSLTGKFEGEIEKNNTIRIRVVSVPDPN